jgi:hypothetical protein
VECVGGVPPSLSQYTKEALFGRVNRLGLHKVFEAIHLNIGAGQRIEPAPPFKDLRGVALRHEGTNNLHKRKKPESIRRKAEESTKSRRKHKKLEKNAPKGILVGQRGARLSQTGARL